MAIQLENIVEYDYQTQTGDTGSTSKNKINGNNTKIAEELSRIDSAKVEKTTKVNKKPLSSDITLNKNDIGLNNVDNTADVDKPVSNAQQTIFNTKTDKTTQVIAGNGLTGGGSLDANRTINVGNTDDSIVIAADGIKVDTQNSLTSTSTTKPLSANQGKILKDSLDTSIADEKSMFPAIAYNKRVLADGGTVVSKQSIIDGYKTMIDLLPNTKLLFCPNAGVKTRTSGIYSYLTKAYDMGVNGLDLTQTTEANQPFINGFIAPSENKYLKSNINSVAKTISHTAVSFLSTDAFSFILSVKPNTVGANQKINISSSSYITINSTGLTLYNGTSNILSTSSILEVGKNSIVEFKYSNGTGLIKINGVPVTTTVISGAISFDRISTQATYFDGCIYYAQIFNKYLSEFESKNTYSYLRSQYPEIEGVNIGNQHWATSNYEGVVTGNGTVIPEVQSASTSVAPELITNQADREFTSDTLYWTKNGANTIISDGLLKITSSDLNNNGIVKTNLLILGKVYNVTYTVVSISSGSVNARIGSSGLGILRTTPGTYSENILCSGDTGFRLYGSIVGQSFEIDNVSIKEVGWADLTTPAWCYYNNDPLLGSVYGKLYNYYAVQEIAKNPPKGWRVPSSADFVQLSTFLGGDAISGGKLKKDGTSYWNATNIATNESGFSAIGGGYRSWNGSDYTYKDDCRLYTSNSKGVVFSRGTTAISFETLSDKRGYSLRLIRNSPVGDQTQNIKVDRFSTNIQAGTANKDVSIPFGYEVRAINIKSAQALSNLQCVMYNYGGGTSQATLITGKSVAAGAEIKFSVNADCPVQYQDPVLRFNATGNGGDGIEITVVLNKIL